MATSMAELRLHRSSGWLSGRVGEAAIARRTRLDAGVQSVLKPGEYQLKVAKDSAEARGIIAILRTGERAIIIEGGHSSGSIRGFVVEGGRAGSERAIIIEGGRTAGSQRGIIVEGGRSGSARGFVVEGGRSAGGDRGFVIEGGRTGPSARTIIIEGGLDWLTALEGGMLRVEG